jgi:hypothetical protein
LQMGVAKVTADALTERAAETLSQKQMVVRGLECSSGNIDPEAVVVTHIRNEEDLEDIRISWRDCPEMQGQIVLAPGNMRRSVRAWIHNISGNHQEGERHHGSLHHQGMGGLTRGCFHAFVMGGKVMRRNAVKFGHFLLIERDPVWFLEPSVKLQEWRWPGKFQGKERKDLETRSRAHVRTHRRL